MSKKQSVSLLAACPLFIMVNKNPNYKSFKGLTLLNHLTKCSYNNYNFNVVTVTTKRRKDYAIQDRWRS